MRNWSGWWIILAIMVLVDIYVFSAVKAVSQNGNEKIKITVYSLYWLVSALSIVTVVLFPYVDWMQRNLFFRTYVFAIIVGLFFAKIIACSFFLIDDLRRGALWLMTKIFPGTGADFTNSEGDISRSVFLSWTGLAFGGGLFTMLLYGFSNKYNYQVKKIKLSFDNLPQAFKGLKIVQISDIHSGSFQDKDAVYRGVEIIKQQNADLILFTGDLVNDRADEMHDYMEMFSSISAPMGIYSTLGNHDYGDYVSWPSEELKKQNLERLKKVHADIGWRLMMNEHAVLEKNGEQIALLGIENWSASSRFPKYGKMHEAYPGTEKYPFKILMSHDPSHWDA
ncbi:MAG TPA: metallophosphoesterase, partial [Chitinophagaceae bacterium]|nr:metallophosphoesterase [Chitinophagaceae bacterium]